MTSNGNNNSNSTASMHQLQGYKLGDTEYILTGAQLGLVVDAEKGTVTVFIILGGGKRLHVDPGFLPLSAPIRPVGTISVAEAIEHMKKADEAMQEQMRPQLFVPTPGGKLI